MSIKPTPPGIKNWLEWHSTKSDGAIRELYSDSQQKHLVLTFRIRSGLKKNVEDLGRYLKVVSEYSTEIETASDRMEHGMVFFELVGETEQFPMDEDRLRGWLGYVIEVSHGFGCWLETWEVTEVVDA